MSLNTRVELFFPQREIEKIFPSFQAHTLIISSPVKTEEAANNLRETIISKPYNNSY